MVGGHSLVGDSETNNPFFPRKRFTSVISLRVAATVSARRSSFRSHPNHLTACPKVRIVLPNGAIVAVPVQHDDVVAGPSRLFGDPPPPALPELLRGDLDVVADRALLLGRGVVGRRTVGRRQSRGRHAVAVPVVGLRGRAASIVSGTTMAGSMAGALLSVTASVRQTRLVVGLVNYV